MSTLDVQLSFSRATSLIGGATGSLPYQTVTSSTVFAPIGANGTILISNGTTATWSAPSSISAGSASQVQTTRLTTNATHFITFVDSDNASATAETVYTTSTLVVNPNTQFVGIGTGSPTATLTVGGGTRISGITTVTNSTQATSTATGALQVDGGAGINRDVYIGGNAFVLGDIEVRGGDFIVNGTTTFNLVDTTATTVNFARAATAITMGALTGSTTVRNNLIVSGNLTVNGATTIVDSTVTNVSDPIFIIGSGPSGANPTADDGRDRGIQFKWHNGTAARDGFFGWDRSAQVFTFIPDATFSNEVVSGTKGAADIHLAGGAAMSIVYQSAANTTAFLAAGTAGHILQTNGTGSAPTWVPANSVSGGTATQVANALTFNNAGSGDASGTTFNGSAARTISYNSVGAPAAGIISTTSARVINGIRSLDSRSVNDTPGERTAGLYVDFKTNTTNGLVDGGTYNGVITFRSYGESNSDFTGGIAQQIAYTDNNNLWHRGSTNSSTWGTWFRILDTQNTGTAHVNLANTVLTVGQATNANYFPVFVDANNAAATAESLFTTSTFVINPNTQQVGIGGNPTSRLHIQGTAADATVLDADHTGFNGRHVRLPGRVVVGSAATAYPDIGYNFVPTNAGGWNYIANDTAYRINFGNSNRITLAYATASTGAITWTDGFILNNSGNVGIGVAPTERFHVAGSILVNGITSGGGNNFVLRGGTGATSEGPQIVMGYGNNTSSAITGQANNSWNIDVASGAANNNFRIFRQNSAGATAVVFESTESTGGVRLIGLGVGTDPSTSTGEIRATNEITAYFGSDRRLKENIRLIENPITLVNQIRGVRFDWTDEHIARRGGEDGYFVRKQDIGVIAQEIEAVLPELVATRDDGFKAVKYEKLVALLIEVVKEQQRQITQIMQRLDNSPIK